MFLTSFLGFVFFIFLFAYLPGKIATHLAKLPDWPDLQLTLGLSLLTLILFFGRWLIPTIWLLSFYLLIIVFLFKKLNLKPLPAKLKIPQSITVVVLIGVVAQSLPYLKIGFLGLDQLTVAIASNHDQSWHAGLIYELTQNFPPQVPGFSGQFLKNYHYFYDLLIAAQASFFNSNIHLLLQLIYPVFISLLFGLAVLRVISLITSNKIIQALGLLLVFFSTNLSFLLIPLGFTSPQSNSLLIDHPLFFLFNHQTVLSLSFILYILIILQHQLARPTAARGIILGLLIASLSYLKVYGFLILALTLAIVTIKNLSKLKLTFLSLSVTILIILSLTLSSPQSFLTFKPFWILSAFNDKIVVPFLPQLYARSGKLGYSLILLILFLLLNFHWQLSGFLAKRKKSIINFIFLLTLISFSFLFSGFQTQSPYNIIQFAPYATVGLSFLTIAFASQLNFKKGPGLLFFSLLFSLPVSFNTLKAFALDQPQLPPLRQEMFDLISVLKYQPDGLVLSLVDRDYHLIPDPRRELNFIGNNLISAIAQKPVFFADQKQLEVLGLDYQPRLDQINYLKQNFCQDKSLLRQAKIDYLIVADDLSHCTGDSQIQLTLLHQTDHFSLLALD